MRTILCILLCLMVIAPSWAQAPSVSEQAKLYLRDLELALGSGLDPIEAYSSPGPVAYGSEGGGAYSLQPLSGYPISVQAEVLCLIHNDLQTQKGMYLQRADEYDHIHNMRKSFIPSISGLYVLTLAALHRAAVLDGYDDLADRLGRHWERVQESWRLYRQKQNERALKSKGVGADPDADKASPRSEARNSRGTAHRVGRNVRESEAKDSSEESSDRQKKDRKPRERKPWGWGKRGGLFLATIGYIAGLWGHRSLDNQSWLPTLNKNGDKVSYAFAELQTLESHPFLQMVSDSEVLMMELREYTGGDCMEFSSLSEIAQDLPGLMEAMERFDEITGLHHGYGRSRFDRQGGNTAYQEWMEEQLLEETVAFPKERQ